jgi:hypothetical protein
MLYQCKVGNGSQTLAKQTLRLTISNSSPVVWICFYIMLDCIAHNQIQHILVVNIILQ